MARTDVKGLAGCRSTGAADETAAAAATKHMPIEPILRTQHRIGSVEGLTMPRSPKANCFFLATGS
jgi:hypothetical protein